MVTRYGDLQGVTGQVTAQVGTVTAAISTVVTAEARGFVTATVTAGTPIGVTGGPMTISGSNLNVLGLKGVTVGNALLVGLMRRTTPPGDDVAVPNFVASWDDDANLLMGVHPVLYDGANYSRQRNNATAVLLPSAASIVGARTAADQINYNSPGVMLLLNIYGTAGTATIGGVIVQAKHNDKYATLTAFARTLTAPGLYPFAFHPGAGAGTLVSGAAPMILPRDWRAIISGALDANASASYQLDAHYVAG